MPLSKESIEIGIRRGGGIVELLYHRVPWIETYQSAWQKYEGSQVLLNGLCSGCNQRFKIVHRGNYAEIIYYTDRWCRLSGVDLNDKWFTSLEKNLIDDKTTVQMLLGKGMICKKFQSML